MAKNMPLLLKNANFARLHRRAVAKKFRRYDDPDAHRQHKLAALFATCRFALFTGMVAGQMVKPGKDEYSADLPDWISSRQWRARPSPRPPGPAPTGGEVVVEERSETIQVTVSF